MIDLGSRFILDDGTVICRQPALMEMLYSGKDISIAFCDNMADQSEWESAARTCDSQVNGPTHADGPQYLGIDWFKHWMTPEPYASIDLHQWCMERCKSSEEMQRVEVEMAAFEEREMIPVMRHLIYCADEWRKNGIFWGVGRGSSVCSFVLYLIGINRINPLEYDLDLGEWLK